MILIEKDFKNYLQEIENLSFKDSGKTNKNVISLEEQYEEAVEKTIVKKQDKLIKKTIINTTKPILCLANLNGILMCGCEKGELVFIRDG
jgi:hypothetical protein